MDVKKLGRINDGGRWKAHGREHGKSRLKNVTGSSSTTSTLVGDHSRPAYSETLSNENGPSCAGFLLRAAGYFARCGISTIETVMTDNHFSYKLSGDMRDAIATLGAKHLFIKAHCPGRTAMSNTSTAPCKPNGPTGSSSTQTKPAATPWLDYYNNRRRHSALGGQPDQPTDTNVLAEYS